VFIFEYQGLRLITKAPN